MSAIGIGTLISRIAFSYRQDFKEFYATALFVKTYLKGCYKDLFCPVWLSLLEGFYLNDTYEKIKHLKLLFLELFYPFRFYITLCVYMNQKQVTMYIQR